MGKGHLVVAESKQNTDRLYQPGVVPIWLVNYWETVL